MAVDSAPVRDAFERPVQALFHRLDVDRELPSSGTRTLVREPEQVEGAGFCPRPVRALQGLPPEIDETRFLWMKGQPEPCESLWEYLQHLLGIVSMLEAQHGVSRPGELHPQALAEPYMRVSLHTAPIVRPRPLRSPQ